MLCGELCQPQTVEIVTGFHKSTVRLSVQVVPNVEPVGIRTRQDPGIRRFQITVQPLWNPLDRRRGGASLSLEREGRNHVESRLRIHYD